MLSVGGRLQLIKSVLSSMPLHILQIMGAPKYLFAKIERLVSRFFWSSSENKNTIHWCTWDKVCYPVEEGGIGIRRSGCE